MPRSSPPSPDSAPDRAASSPDVDPASLVRVGFVYRPHGVHGEVKVNPDDTDDPTRFETFDAVYVGHRPHEAAPYAIASVRYQETKRGVTVILRLDAVDSRDAAEAIAKANVYAHEDDLDLGDEELFIHDLIGMDVVTDDGDPVGTVGNLLQLPGHDVLVVTRPDAAEGMIPLVDEFVLDVDFDANRVVVRLIEGLLE